MELRFVLAIGFLVVFGLYFGRMVARGSIQAQPIHGGKTAEALHYAACAIMAGLVPSILVEVLVFRIGTRSILIGVVALIVVFTCLTAFAAVELPARAAARQQEDKGWTAEKARTSGL